MVIIDRSFSEIGFVLQGRKSIFFLNIIIFLSCFGLMMIYFIVFGNIASSIVRENVSNKKAIYCDRTFYVLIIAASLLPLIMKKEIGELKIASILLFGTIIIFILIFILQFVSEGNFANHDEIYSEYYEFKIDRSIITSMSILLIAYGFQQNFFPTYRNLSTKNNSNGIKAATLAILVSIFIYTIIAILSIYMFGSALTADVLNNIANEDSSWESYVLRISFLIILGCHIPFIFFAGKEGFLTVIDEIDRRTISKALEDLIIGDLSYQHENLVKDHKETT